AWDSTFGSDGGHNTDTDPLFTDPAGGDYTLQGSSSAVDAGNDQLYWDVVNGGSPMADAKDLLGNTRPFAAAIDLGAYEVQIRSQIISPIADIAKTYGDAAFEPGGTASSGLEIHYSSSDNSIAE